MQLWLLQSAWDTNTQTQKHATKAYAVEFANKKAREEAKEEDNNPWVLCQGVVCSTAPARGSA